MRYRLTDWLVFVHEFISTISLLYVKLTNRINTLSIFYSVNCVFGKIEEQIIQKIQLAFKQLLY